MCVCVSERASKSECECSAAVVYITLFWYSYYYGVIVPTEEVVSKISVQLEKSKKDLPAFDIVENLVEEEVGYYTCGYCLYHIICSLEHFAMLQIGFIPC